MLVSRFLAEENPPGFSSAFLWDFLLTKPQGRTILRVISCGGVAQLGARTVRIRKVGSSILLVSTKILDDPGNKLLFPGFFYKDTAGKNKDNSFIA